MRNLGFPRARCLCTSVVVAYAAVGLILFGAALKPTCVRADDGGNARVTSSPASKPADVRLRKDRAREAITRLIENAKIPGASIAVIEGFQIEWADGYGVRRAGGDEAVDTETLFQAASISKPVAALAALRLVEAGKLNLDEDVNRRLVAWKLPDNKFTETQKVTVRHLLSHTGGVTVHGFPGYPSDTTAASLLEVLDGKPPANTAEIRVDTIPGTKWRYAGGGYCIMQQMVVDVTGQSFPMSMQELVLEPLEMTRSTYQQPLPKSLEENAAIAHRIDGTTIPSRWHVYPEMAAAGLWDHALRPGPVLHRFARCPGRSGPRRPVASAGPRCPLAAIRGPNWSRPCAGWRRPKRPLRSWRIERGIQVHGPVVPQRWARRRGDDQS